jgi:hypothetical protein
MLAALPLLFLLGLPATLQGQATVAFHGRLVHVDGLSTGNLRVGFGPYGSTSTRGNGQFQTALPVGVGEVKVEILEHDWVVLYPRDGRIPVPRDADRVVEIVVGESVEAAALRLFAERHERLAAGLNAVGAGQEEIKRVLGAFLKEVTQRLSVDEAALERQIELQRKRGEHYPTLSSTIRSYVLEAKDIKDAFKLYGTIAFTDREAYQTLHRAAEKYNGAFQKLNNERMAYEYQVATYWESEELRSDLRALYDFALGEVHTIRMLQLNESLVTMHQALWGGLRNRQQIRDAQGHISSTVRELELRLPELERRADRVLQYLLRN